MSEEIIIRLISLPATVRGFTITDSDGNYNIYINQSLPREVQNAAVAHEIKHVLRGDPHSEKFLRELEFD